MGRLDPCVPRADHDHIIVSKMVHTSPFYLPTQNFSNTSSMTASEAFSPVRS